MKKKIKLSNDEHPDRQLAIEVMNELNGIAWCDGELTDKTWRRYENVIARTINKWKQSGDLAHR
jgi:hypothetical protein